MKKENTVRRIFLIAAAVSFIVAALLIVWSFVSQINFLEEKYEEYIRWLTDLENSVASIDNLWLLTLVIMLMYFVKTTLPLYPVWIMSVMSAMVFDVYKSFVVNICGMMLLFSVKYVIGTNSGGGNAQKLIRKSSVARKIVESEGKGNPWVLLALRILPGTPINSVSQLYGSMECPFWKFLLISVLGYLPKMATYIVIGKNMSNPFSLKFSIPLILLCVFSGIAFLAMRTVWDIIDKVKVQKQGDLKP